MPHLICLFRHLQGPVTLIPITEHLAVEMSLPVLTTYVCRSWDSNTQPSITSEMYPISLLIHNYLVKLEFLFHTNALLYTFFSKSGNSSFLT